MALGDLIYKKTSKTRGLHNPNRQNTRTPIFPWSYRGLNAVGWQVSPYSQQALRTSPNGLNEHRIEVLPAGGCLAVIFLSSTAAWLPQMTMQRRCELLNGILAITICHIFYSIIIKIKLTIKGHIRVTLFRPKSIKSLIITNQ